MFIFFKLFEGEFCWISCALDDLVDVFISWMFHLLKMLLFVFRLLIEIVK